MKRITILTAAAILLFFASGARADTIEEISVDSVDTTFDYVASPVTDSELKIEQDGVTVVVEKPGNVQEEVSGAFFSLVTNLGTDSSGGGKAIGNFLGGTLLIEDAFSVTLLAGDVIQLTLEEATNLPHSSVLAGSGTFDVTGGTWASSFGPEGIILDLTWTLGNDISGFAADFSGESDVTLIPEPTVLSLLLIGGLALLGRRKK